ncbi:hypothetical protein ABZ860_33065 [Microbispora sp. NPDC046973]|uniref:hypothetical protein n=1 Tax=Microbispora sp. NPDC046973 TaxID=3155022 RepID=UPI0034115846
MTAYADGWCRTERCEGFTQPDAPEGWSGTAKHGIAGTGALEVLPLASVPLEPPDTFTISVTRAAIQRFQSVHGGRPNEAEAQIRSLLEDLLLGVPGTRVTRSQKGGWSLRSTSPKGYAVIVSSDAEAVVAYATVHRERTYAQARAGVASRTEGTGKRSEGQ